MAPEGVEIPYRLETRADIQNAMDEGLLGLKRELRVMLEVAKRVPLQKPLALMKAKASVQKEFYKLKMLLGHKSITMTMRYAHHYPESLRSSVEVLDDLSQICHNQGKSSTQDALQNPQFSSRIN